MKSSGTWLPGAVLNIAECCLLPSTHPRKEDNSCAVVWREEGCDDSDLNCMTLKELREQVMYDFICLLSLLTQAVFCFVGCFIFMHIFEGIRLHV